VHGEHLSVAYLRDPSCCRYRAFVEDNEQAARYVFYYNRAKVCCVTSHVPSKQEANIAR
jgi:hypothetical protein